MNTRLRLLLSFLLVLGFFNLANAEGMVLTPPKFEFNADSGEEISGLIKITNQNTDSLVLIPSVKDFVASGESGQQKFVEPDSANVSALAQWITVNNGESVEISPGEKREVPFFIKVPEDAEPGGKYGTIFFETPSTGGQIAVTQRIGVLVLLKVNGEIKEEGNISAFGLYDPELSGPDLLNHSSNFFYSSLPVNFSLRYQNTGNVHIKPEAKIYLKNMFGRDLKQIGVRSVVADNGVEIKKEIVDYIPLNDSRGNVLARSFRKFDAEFKGTPYWYTQENGSKVIKYKGLYAGLYTADLELISAKGEIINKSLSFLIIPWQKIAIFILAILIIYFFTKHTFAYYRKKIEAELRKEISKK